MFFIFIFTPYYQPFSTTDGSADRYGIIITVPQSLHAHGQKALDIGVRSLIPIVIPSRCLYVLARGGVLRTPAQLQRARLLALVALPQPPGSAAQQEVLRGLQQIAHVF